MDTALWPYGKCEKCTNKNYCGWSNAEIANCMNNDYQNFSPMTNADRIRAMTDEELAEWMAINTDCFFCKVKNKNICSLDAGTCTEEWRFWLKSPADKEGAE